MIQNTAALAEHCDHNKEIITTAIAWEILVRVNRTRAMHRKYTFGRILYHNSIRDIYVVYPLLHFYPVVCYNNLHLLYFTLELDSSAIFILFLEFCFKLIFVKRTIVTNSRYSCQ